MDRNPFEYGRELDAHELVDRDVELREIAATIRNRGKLFVIGPRRFGKTSLLAAAGERAEAEDVIVLRFDAEKYETLDLLARAILTAAARALRHPAERVAELIGRAAARLRPEIRIAPDGEILVGLGVREEKAEVAVLGDALDAVEALARGTDRTAVVILDEVQQIVIEHGAAAERQLRSTVQTHRHVGYVFAGSATRLLTAMTEDPDRPFYRLGARLFIGAIPREDFVESLRAGFRDADFTIEDQALSRLLDLAEDVPYNVQRLAHEAWEMLRTGEIATLDPGTIDTVLERIVSREDPAYSQIWNGLTRNQKKALKAVIASDGTETLASAITARFQIAASSLNDALGGLETAHIIRVEALDGGKRYRLVDPFFAGWLAVVQRL